MSIEDLKQEMGKAFIKTADGEIQELKLKSIIGVEITSANKDDAIDTMKYAIDPTKEETLNITISRELSNKILGINRISRKRFIKLLMGCRVPKNAAIQFAEIVHRQIGYYTPMIVQKTIEWLIEESKKDEK